MTTSRRTNRKTLHLTRFLVLLGLVAIITVAISLKEKPEATTPPGDPPVIQLESALSEGKPVLVFYHSNTCESCLQMIDIVHQAYPEFAGVVVLVDVNVYDPKNESLMKKAGVQYIPTLMLYHPTGRIEKFVGVMEKEDLRQALTDLAGGG
jgi:thiol-disulfide isomerase/thioredoxin